MEYKKTKLKREISVQDVISLHYFEYTVDFAFSGEMHDFWEIIYADKGDLCITADTEELIVPQGNLYVHKPMEFHNVRGNGQNAPNSVIFSFSSHSRDLFEISGRVILCDETEKNLLAQIISETCKAFSTPLGDPYTKALVRREDAEYGSEQLIHLYLETLLISLIRKVRSNQTANILPLKSEKRRKDEARLREICNYLAENVEGNISSKDICRKFFISESSLQKLFHFKVGCGAMQFYQKLKIDRAKMLIREKNLNFSEIAEKLGYSSIHYFSRRFKSISGMTPSEYAYSVKSLSKL